MTNWSYYKTGSRPGGAGLTVVKRLHAGRNQDETLYLVEMDCCGDRILNHSEIRRRKGKNYRRCKYCMVKPIGQASRPRPVIEQKWEHLLPSAIPSWPVPPSVAAMRDWMWADRGGK